MAETTLFMMWSRPEQIRFLGCEDLACKSNESRVSLVLSWAGSAKKEPPSAQDMEGASAIGFLPFVFSLNSKNIPLIPRPHLPTSSAHAFICPATLL